MKRCIVIFGESEKGRFHYPYICSSLVHLSDLLGNAIEASYGIPLAIQAIMYERDVIFFRVQEEGYSLDDYVLGFEILKKDYKIKNLSAICLPKVSNHEIIDLAQPICKKSQMILIISKKDLFDYLISK